MIEITHLSVCIGRQDDYAVQHRDGHYTRAFRPLSPKVLTAHLAGEMTIGTYVRDAQGYCRFAVFDADQEDGVARLTNLQEEFAREQRPSYLERSRRGGHLWLFFREPVPAEHVRAWLWPIAQLQGLELYPKQGHGEGIGSLIRVPLGIHRKSGRRYPFVDARLQPVASTLREMLAWLGTVERTLPPPLSLVVPPASEEQPRPFLVSSPAHSHNIRAWNAQHDPLTFLGRFVHLNQQGAGCCPFGWHHSGGRDTHASFRVYQPKIPGGYCWYCYAWEHGGSVFDFLRYWYHLDARELWRRICAGELSRL